MILIHCLNLFTGSIIQKKLYIQKKNETHLNVCDQSCFWKQNRFFLSCKNFQRKIPDGNEFPGSLRGLQVFHVFFSHSSLNIYLENIICETNETVPPKRAYKVLGPVYLSNSLAIQLITLLDQKHIYTRNVVYDPAIIYCVFNRAENISILIRHKTLRFKNESHTIGVLLYYCILLYNTVPIVIVKNTYLYLELVWSSNK